MYHIASLVKLTGWTPDVIRAQDAEEMTRIVEYREVLQVAQFGGRYEVS